MVAKERFLNSGKANRLRPVAPFSRLAFQQKNMGQEPHHQAEVVVWLPVQPVYLQAELAIAISDLKRFGAEYLMIRIRVKRGPTGCQGHTASYEQTQIIALQGGDLFRKTTTFSLN